MLECWQQAAKFKVSVGLWIIVGTVIIGDMMRFRLFELPFVHAQTKKLEKFHCHWKNFMVIIHPIMHMHKRSNTMPVY